jgi:hypothetical protein
MPTRGENAAEVEQGVKAGASAAQRRTRELALVAEAVVKGKVRKLAPSAQSSYAAELLEGCKRSLRRELGHAHMPTLLERDDRAVQLWATKGHASEDPKDAWPWWKPKDERAHREDLKADARDAAAGRLVAFRAHTEAYSTVPTGFFEQWQKDSAAGEPLPTTAPDVVARVKKTFLAAHYCKLPGDLPTSLRQGRITTGLPINDHRALIKRGETAINSLIDVFNKLSNEESLQLQWDLMDRKETNPDVWTALDGTDPRHYVRYRMASLLEKDVYKEVRARTDGKFTGKREDRGDTLTRYARTFSEIKQELAWRCEHIKGQSGRPQDVTLDEWAAMLRKLGLGDGLSAVALRTLGFSVNEDPEAARSSVRQRRKMRK